MKRFNTSSFTKRKENGLFIFEADVSDLDLGSHGVPNKIELESEKTGKVIIFTGVSVTRDNDDDVLRWNFCPSAGQTEPGQTPLCLQIYND